MRILVTGSREWTDWETIQRALQEAGDGDWNTLIHGDCSTGADSIADNFGCFCCWEIERYPADWAKYGKAAGPVRNQEMVDAGADICLAFFQPGAANRGTADCVSRAEKAG